MNSRQLCSQIGLGLMGSVAIATATLAQDSIPVTGGFANFRDAQIFVPVPGSLDPRTVVFSGETPRSFLIRTTQGNIPLNAIFTSTTLPTLNTVPGTLPGIGDRGNVLGSLTFRGFTASGEPGIYSNIPTELNFVVTSGNFTSPFVQSYTQYQTAPTTFTQTGTIATPTSFTTTTRTLPVVLVQFQPGFAFPQSNVVENIFVPARAYLNTIVRGVSYTTNFNTALTSGSVSIPTPPGINPSGSVTATPVQTGEIFTPLTPPSTFIPGFTGLQGLDSIPPATLGRGQITPILPGNIVVGVFTFTSVPSGYWYDPPLAEAFNFTMTESPQPIGIASRVFPGMMGTETQTSLFTAISGFPQGIDADDRFTVAVEDVTLGEFSPGQILRFSDYAAELGDLLQNDKGVASFTISAIDPGVDAADPRAFPIKLEFSTPTASFEMRARGENLEETSMSAFRLFEAVEQQLIADFQTASSDSSIAHFSQEATISAIENVYRTAVWENLTDTNNSTSLNLDLSWIAPSSATPD
jgi:hypothetical protein